MKKTSWIYGQHTKTTPFLFGGVSIQPRLFSDAELCLFRKLFAMKWNRYFSCFRGMHIVPMRPFLIFEYPSVPQNFLFHFSWLFWQPQHSFRLYFYYTNNTCYVNTYQYIHLRENFQKGLTKKLPLRLLPQGAFQSLRGKIKEENLLHFCSV